MNNENIVISSRIRLARNIKKYPFSDTISPKQSLELIEESKAISRMNFIDMSDTDNVRKQALLENHIISQNLIDRKKPCGVLTGTNANKNVNIMVNEEDHLRIQSIYDGFDIENAYEKANEIDDLFANNTEYAFNKNFGYLTTCLSNTGTGLRASFMIHIPMIEALGQLSSLAYSISKFGMVIRGIYGEGSKSIGGIYQISNEITLGRSENEIIENIKNITMQIAEKEMQLRKANNNDDFADKIYRSYGILKYCRKISSAEAASVLSNIQIGKSLDFKEINTNANIYDIIRNIQPANIIEYMNKKNVNNKDRDFIRAEYIRSVI